VARDPTRNVRHLADVLARFGLADRWAYRFPIEPRWYGLSDVRRREIVESADLLLDVSGVLEEPDRHRGRGPLVYIDSDPVFTQVKLAAGTPLFSPRVAAHDVHFSFGERLAGTPLAGAYRWHPTRQPILLSEWQPSGPMREVYTTVMSWTSYEPLVWGGETYGQKDVEFRRYLGLAPQVAPIMLEVALATTRHAYWEAGAGDHASPAERLRRAGWRVVDAGAVCADLDAYRAYIESSKGEWSVQKNGYVRGRPGWFSCRSACYLAAGRPVVVQDTGCTGLLPIGEGILTFTTLEEAAAAIAEVEAQSTRHRKAARAIAEAYFASDRVLSQLLDTVATVTG
jgi:hypothetical protein